jgi:ADP-ribose pyrophosphatase
MSRIEEIYKGRVFSLVREIVDLPNGRRANLDIIQHPGAAAMLPVTDKGLVLLLKQYRHAAGGFLWEIPAGTLNPDESPQQCAYREIEEETGYRAEKMEKLAVITPVPGYSTEKIHIFLATGLTASTQNLDQDEVLTVHAFSQNQVWAMLEKGEITDAKTICALLLAKSTLPGLV